MRELFPMNVPSGSQLTTGWMNQAGRMLNRMGQFASGSTMSGIRTGGFNADLPHPPTWLIPALVIAPFDEEGEVIDPAAARRGLPIDILNVDRYKIQLLEWQSTTTGLANNNGGWSAVPDPDKQVYVGYVGWETQQFLIPGDVVYFLWDYVAGQFICFNPPNIRLAVVEPDVNVELDVVFPSIGVVVKGGDIGPKAAGLVRVVSQPLGISGLQPPNDFNDLFFDLVVTNTWACQDETLVAGEKVIIGYIQPDERWYVIDRCQRRKQKHIDFTLNAALTKADAEVEVTVQRIYEPQLLDFAGVPIVDPASTSVGATIEIENPPSVCTADDQIFEGDEDCYGMAVFSETTGKYVIWQLECPEGA